jgi:hypothetical protein
LDREGREAVLVGVVRADRAGQRPEEARQALDSQSSPPNRLAFDLSPPNEPEPWRKVSEFIGCRRFD